MIQFRVAANLGGGMFFDNSVVKNLRVPTRR